MSRIFNGYRKSGIIAALTVGAALLAPQTTSSVMAVEEGPNTGNVSLTFGADFTTGYYFRGIVQEDQGFIFQPYVDVGIALFSSEDGPINSVDFYFGTWSSLHDEQTGGNGNIYETDYYFGVALTVADLFGVDIAYVALTSPNGAFGTVQEIDLTFSFDDSGMLGDFALSPYVMFVFELDGSTAGNDESSYIEIGVEPGLEIVESEDYPIAIAFPVAIGFSTGGYYDGIAADGIDDDTFGFISLGAVASTPLSFIPAEFGSWEAAVGITVLLLGDDNEAANNGDDTEVIGTFGLSVSY